MRSTSFVALLLISLLLAVSVAQSKIIQLQYVSRHCDRTPVAELSPSGKSMPRVLPVEPIIWKDVLGLKDGQLTGLGMYQCMSFGHDLRARYITGEDASAGNNVVAGISPKFNVDDYYFISTDYDRTIQSVWAESMGLFPGLGPHDDLRNSTALPNGVQPVPIYVITRKEDNLLRGYQGDLCPALGVNLQQFKQTPTYQGWLAKYNPFIQNATKMAGFPDNKFTLDNFYELYDLLVVQKSHRLLTNQAMLDMYDEAIRVGGASTFSSFNRNVQGKLAGGPLLQLILKKMQDMIASKKGHKWTQYSGHDTSIMSVFSALNLQDESYQLIPPYGSQLIFELHQDDNDASKYFVRIVFRRGFDGAFEYVTLKTLGSGCEQDCPMAKFAQLLLVESIPASWCTECGNSANSKCVDNIMLSKNTETIVLSVAVALLALGNVVLFICLAGYIAYIRFFAKKRMAFQQLNQD